MAISKPFNLTKWIDENRQLLKPPVGNKNLYTDSGDYIVMVVGSKCPKRFHYNETEELFYHLRVL
jgi:3-hydroxyanthranilate 3,4-dioxygenase